MKKQADIKIISAAAARWVARRDAGLSADDAVEFEQWLAADERHASAFEHYARTWAAFDQQGNTGARVAMMRELEARARRRRTRRTRTATATAGALMLCVCAFLWQWPRIGRDGGLLFRNSLPSRTVVMQPEHRVLDDGSVVELRPGAQIEVCYDETVRRVILVNGAAHFQVVKGLLRPFVVVAGDMEVRAVGTAFAVQLGASQVEVLVTEGRVAVEKFAPMSNSEEQLAAEVADDTELSVAPETASDEPRALATLGVRERIVVETVPEAVVPVVTVASPAEINERLAWRIPRLEFSGTPLTEAVALINRSSRLPDGSASARLVIDSSLSGLMSEPVSGFFRADNIEAFVHLLTMSMDIESERRGDEIILRKAKRE